MNFTSDSEDLFCWDKQKKNYFYELWQQHKQLKTIEMSAAWPDTYDEGYNINSNLNPLTKFTTSSRSTEFKDILPWNVSQMITKTIPIRTRIVISYAMKRGIPFWVYWEVNGNWDNKWSGISLWKESHCRTNTSVRRNKKIPKSRAVRITIRDPSKKVNHLSKVIFLFIYLLTLFKVGLQNSWK